MTFFFFWIFYNFFWECSSLGRVEAVLGTDFFFFLFWPGLAWNKARMTLIFFYFFGNAPVQVRHKRYPERIFFFFSFSAYPGPVLLEMPERRFLKFFYFFFLNFFGNAPTLVGQKQYLEWFLFFIFRTIPVWFSYKWSQNVYLFIFIKKI